MGLSTRALGKALGVSHSYASRLVRRGCPAEPTEARVWMAENIQACHRPSRLGERKSEVGCVAHGEPHVRREPIVFEQLNGDGDFGESLARLRSLEKGLVAAIEGAMKAQNFGALLLLRKELVAISRGLYEGTIKDLAIRKARGRLISIEASRAFMTSILSPLAADLRSLPSRAAGPEARHALEEAAELLTAKIREYVTRAEEKRGC
jgi:hypothetical protein